MLQLKLDKTREYFERLIFHVFNADIIPKFYLELSKLISSTCSVIFDDMLTWDNLGAPGLNGLILYQRIHECDLHVSYMVLVDTGNGEG